MTFIQRVPLFLFVFIIFNLVMAAAPEMVVPHIIEDSAPAPVAESAAAPEAPAPAPAAAEPAATLPADAPTEATPPAPAPEAAKTADAEAVKPVGDAERVSLSVKPLFKVQLPSGLPWYPTMNDVLLLFAVIVLYVELIKSARAPAGSIVEHMMSMFVFCAFLVEFLVHKSAGTSAFLIVTMLAMIDVVAGFMLASARASFPVKH
jgi:hypothetical protein